MEEKMNTVLWLIIAIALVVGAIYMVRLYAQEQQRRRPLPRCGEEISEEYEDPRLPNEARWIPQAYRCVFIVLMLGIPVALLVFLSGLWEWWLSLSIGLATNILIILGLSWLAEKGIFLHKLEKYELALIERFNDPVRVQGRYGGIVGRYYAYFPLVEQIAEKVSIRVETRDWQVGGKGNGVPCSDSQHGVYFVLQVGRKIKNLWEYTQVHDDPEQRYQQVVEELGPNLVGKLRLIQASQLPVLLGYLRIIERNNEVLVELHPEAHPNNDERELLNEIIIPTLQLAARKCYHELGILLIEVGAKDVDAASDKTKEAIEEKMRAPHLRDAEVIKAKGISATEVAKKAGVRSLYESGMSAEEVLAAGVAEHGVDFLGATNIFPVIDARRRGQGKHKKEEHRQHGDGGQRNNRNGREGYSRKRKN